MPKPEQSFAQILGFAPFVLSYLGLPQEKINIVVSALGSADAILEDGSPNMAHLLKMKQDLDNVQVPVVYNRLVCAHCRKINTF